MPAIPSMSTEMNTPFRFDAALRRLVVGKALPF
jgi:hypothetical protein